jgi:hypothetical protein
MLNIKTQPIVTNISLENFDSITQNILQPYITPYLSSKNKKDRDDIVYRASQESKIQENHVNSVLGWERHRIQRKKVREIMEVHENAGNQAFLDEYKIREKIPKENLPCFAGINMFGEVQYSKKMSTLRIFKGEYLYIFKVDNEYLCRGLRT